MTVYNIKEAAKILGVHPQTLRGWDKKGKLKPAFRTVGGERRYTTKQLEEFINRGVDNKKEE